MSAKARIVIVISVMVLSGIIAGGAYWIGYTHRDTVSLDTIAFNERARLEYQRGIYDFCTTVVGTPDKCYSYLGKISAAGNDWYSQRSEFDPDKVIAP